MKDKIDFWIKILLIILVSLLSILFLMSKPTITLKGERKIILNLNEKYVEPGYVASFMLKDEKGKVEVKSNIDNTKVGTYKVVYTLKTKKNKVVKERVVKIVDNEKPSINLTGSGHACPGQVYVEEGYQALDNYDGDITDKVKTAVKDNYITYYVKDSSDNQRIVKRPIIYMDKEAPKIALIGEGIINIYVGDEYKEPGYIITDNCDNEVSNKISVTGDINTNQVGRYTLTYSVTDNSGNNTVVTREINVIEPYTPPAIDGRGKTIYLTFDDGPSASITPSLLRILKEENVKATFFVTNHSDSLNSLIKQEYDEGHTVALHSYTHNYSYIYSSVDNYYNDLNSIRDKVYNITGAYPTIIRFPGGSSNTVSRRYSSGIMSTLTTDVTNKGYKYFDWNVSSEDAGGARNETDVYNNVVNNLVYKNNVVLLHDFESNYKTLNAIRGIIRYGKENGFTFKAITKDTPVVRHRVNN